MAYYMASVSWGKDSLAMLLRLINENKPLNEVVFFDTGMEFQAIYNVRDAVLGMLKVRGITYTELKPDEPFLYSMLERPKTKRTGEKVLGNGWCGGPCRWGTFQKLRALDKYAKSKNAVVYIGLAADEVKRLENLESYKRAPLAEFWNMTEAECLQYCYNHHFYWYEDTDSEAKKIRLYDVLDRVSCWCCCNKNLKELRNIYNFLPEYWQRLRYLQFVLERPMKGYYKGQPRGVFELEDRFSKEANNDTFSK